MKRVSILILFAACLTVMGCSDTDTENEALSPVLMKAKKIHIPGANADDLSSDQRFQSNPVEKSENNPPVVNPNPVEPVVIPDPAAPETDPKVPETDPEPIQDPSKNPNVVPDPNQDPDIDDDAPVFDEIDGVPVQPLTYKPYTTLQIAHRPTIGTSYYKADYVKALIAAHEFRVFDKDLYEKYGLGLSNAEGEPWILKENLLKVTDPDISHKGQSLAYFWQISDPQIIDEESPCRMEGVTYTPYVYASAYRPQGGLSTQMFDLHVQTARRISDRSSRPFDFALVTGDVADNAQVNENAWFQRMMAGGVLDPDTGIDDDPIPGPGNDFNDPFYAKGIGDIPWYIAIGNHDSLYMGFSEFDDRIQNACTGDKVVDLFDFLPVASHEFRNGYQNGFQDGSLPDSPIVVTGTTPADPDRRLLSKTEAIEKFYEAPGFPKGHGLDPEIMAAGWGYYSTYPIPGKPIRLITLDTNSGVYSEANMTTSQFNWLENQLNDAKSKHELVVVQSHHGTEKLSGTVSQTKFQELLSSYPNVILHITGHGHCNDSHVYTRGERGYWEVMLASVVDFPSQTRIFEIVHEGGGLISIYITNLDMNTPKGTLGDTAYHYAAAREFFGMSDDPVAEWEAEKEHRNLILRTRVPEDIYKNIEKYEWSETIESETTLQNFEYHPVH